MNRRVIIIAVITAVLVLPLWYGVGEYYHHTQYELGVYDCSDMTKDQKAFFDSLGLETTIIHKWTSVRVVDNQVYIIGHYWLRIHIGPLTIPWECTRIRPTLPREGTPVDHIPENA